MKWLALLWLAAPAQAWLFNAGSVDAPRRHFREGRYQEAAAALSPEALQKMRGRPLREAYWLLGQSHERLGQNDKAMSVYQLAIKLFPSDIPLLTATGQLLHKMGLEDRAEPIYQRVLKLQPGDPAAHLGLAEIERALGFLESSASRYEHALEQRPDDPRVWRDYAETLYQLRDYKTAELAAQRALAGADTPETRILLAHVQRGAGRLDSALETLAGPAAARRDAALVRALWLLEAARYPEAQAAAENALRDSPDDPLARYVRARCLLKADRYNAAVADLEAAAAGAREAPFVAKVAQETLQRLRGSRRP